MNTEVVFSSKTEARAALRAAAGAIPPAEKAAFSARIAEAVLQSEAFRRASNVFIYVSLPGEPETRPLLLETLRQGKALYVPKCLKRPEMLAVRIRGLEELAPGPFGIPEPPAPAPYAAPRLDLAVVPCVGVTPEGVRLGHGGGYYDRFLSGSAAVRLCLCFSSLVCLALPREAHDVPMDLVATERGLFACAAPGKERL